jgi:hypothetical protein
MNWSLLLKSIREKSHKLIINGWFRLHPISLNIQILLVFLKGKRMRKLNHYSKRMKRKMLGDYHEEKVDENILYI